MKTDPRKGCANERELWHWAAVHDLIAHPLMVLTGYSRLSLRFHDFTSHRAWPRPSGPRLVLQRPGTPFGTIRVMDHGNGIYRVHHGHVNHAITTKASSPYEAFGFAFAWFSTLAHEFDGKFALCSEEQQP